MPENNQFLALLDKEKPKIINMLPPETDDRARERWWAFTYEFSRSAKLQKVAAENPMSLMNALYKFADWGLIPDGEEGHINVYNEKVDGKWLPIATPEPMYKGLIQRGITAGVIVHCVGDVLRDGDIVKQSIGIHGRTLEVTPAPAKKGRKLVGSYAMYWLPNGLMDFEIFDEEDIAAGDAAYLRNARRHNENAELSPARKFYPGEMAKKGVIKRGLKRMRGKRDTEAGRRFADMIATDDKTFDVETTSEELPPDNLPNGNPTVEPKPAKSAVKLVADDAPPSDDEQATIIAAVKKAKVRVTDFKEWAAANLGEQFALDIDDLKAVHVAPVLKALENYGG